MERGIGSSAAGRPGPLVASSRFVSLFSCSAGAQGADTLAALASALYVNEKLPKSKKVLFFSLPAKSVSLP